MKHKVLTVLVLLLLFLGGQFIQPAQRAAAQADAWTPGEYTGWVYFLARSDYDYNLSEAGVTVQDTTVLYHEVHGTLDCTVVDEDGNGNCSASFPMEKIAGRYGSLTSDSCNATWTESIRAIAVDSLVPLAPLTSSSLAGGFSIPFVPQSGPGYAELKIDASGGPTCRSAAISAQTRIGIPEWPPLDFHIGVHTPLSAGGTCNMESFPRQMEIGHAVTSAVIEQCQWHMFFFDPYARLP